MTDVPHRAAVGQFRGILGQGADIAATYAVLRAEADARIRKLPGVRQVEVAVTFDPPWTPERMTEDARLLLNL